LSEESENGTQTLPMQILNSATVCFLTLLAFLKKYKHLFIIHPKRICSFKKGKHTG